MLFRTAAWILPALAATASISIAHAQTSPTQAEASEAALPNPKASKNLKTKIAVGRFSNETRYGQTLLRDADLDPLGKQASDILAAYLVKTDKFLVFERPDLTKIQREQERADESVTVAADTLIVGSIVEFGRTEDGKRGLFNKKRVQRAHAKVAIRLVDVRTGLAYFSATGSGEADTESKTTLGIGSTAKYDATLTDKALSAAVEDMLEELINELSAREWKTDILAVQSGPIFIAGGEDQGLAVGDHLKIVMPGKTVKSSQTGFHIQLPAKTVGELEVTSLFGESETNEGAITKVISGSIVDYDPKQLLVVAD